MRGGHRTQTQFRILGLTKTKKGFQNSAGTFDVTRTTGTQQRRPESPTITPPGMRLIQAETRIAYDNSTWHAIDTSGDPNRLR